MSAVLRWKAGARWDTPTPGGSALIAAGVAAAQRFGRDVLVTAGTNDHTTGRHPLGEALDLSVAGWRDADILALYRFLQVWLGPAFTVLYEVPQRMPGLLEQVAYVNSNATGAHVHLQVKKGTVYPPSEGV